MTAVHWNNNLDIDYMYADTNKSDWIISAKRLVDIGRVLIFTVTESKTQTRH